MDVDKICRACMTLSGPLMPLFQLDNAKRVIEESLADMFLQTTDLRLHYGDGLPEKVCLACISEINRSYAFRLKCRNSNTMLRQLLPDAHTEQPNKLDSATQTAGVPNESRKISCAAQTDAAVAVAVAVQHKHTQTVADEITSTKPTLSRAQSARVLRNKRVLVKNTTAVKKTPASNTTASLPLDSSNSQDVDMVVLLDSELSTAIEVKPDLKPNQYLAATTSSIEVESLEVDNLSVENENDHGSKPPKHNDSVTSYVCGNCEAVFFSAVGFSSHVRRCKKPAATDRQAVIDSRTKTHSCKQCIKAFSTKSELEVHVCIPKEKKGRAKIHQCDDCSKCFSMASTLRDHKRIHTGERPFNCTMCEKAFTQKANLRQHILRHSETKSFKCNLCEKSYVTRSELKSHLRTHTGDKPYQCSYCEARFTSSCSMVKHERSHTGERPYACEQCPSRFSSLNVLKNHRRTHSAEKPFGCKFCPKRFKQKGDCYVHEHKIHKDQFDERVKAAKPKARTKRSISPVHYTICDEDVENSYAPGVSNAGELDELIVDLN